MINLLKNTKPSMRFNLVAWLALLVSWLTPSSPGMAWQEVPPIEPATTQPDRKAERRAERKRRLASQPLLDTLIPRDHLRQDFQLFREILEKAHGGLYLHTPKSDFDQAFQAVQDSLTEPLTVRQFNMKLAALVDKIHCGHSSITISDRQLDHFMKAGQLFPVPVIFLRQKAYVDHDRVGLPLGAEILAINDMPMKEVTGKLLPLAPSDGLSSAMKYRTLPIDFDLAYALAYGEPGQFKIEFRPHGETDSQVRTLPAIPGKKTVALYESRYSAGSKSKKYAYRSLDEQTGLLVVNTFEFGISKKSKQKYKDFLKETFESISGDTGRKNLIIDIRENEGGYPKNELLLTAYLTPQPFREMKNARIKTLTIPSKEHLDRREFPQDLVRYVEKQLVADFEKAENGSYQIKEAKNPLRQPRKTAFQGNLYVLTSGTTHSGASSLCSLLREQPNVTFLGEETGGCSAAFTAGNLLVYNLPHSWCQIVVPIIRYETNLLGSKYPAHRGIIPDHPVEQTPDDLLEGTDTVLQFALKLIKNKKSSRLPE